MVSQDRNSQKGRTNRHMGSRNTESLQDNKSEKKTAVRRRFSCNGKLTVKRNIDFTQSPTKKVDNFPTKPHYKISTDVISFEMEEQRNAQMKIISNDQQLINYYLAFKKLFLILFQASNLIIEDNAKSMKKLFQNKSIIFLCLIFQVNKTEWSQKFLKRMKPLSKNLLFFANNPNEFERRIDLVARKVTLQNDKKQKIKNAFLNPKIQRAWEQTVQPYFPDEEIEAYVDDQFETPQEKLCFIDIKDFIVNKLSTEQFEIELETYCALQEIDDDLNLDFKFQFLLTEQFSFRVPPCLIKDVYQKPLMEEKPIQQVISIKKEQTQCSIM